MATDNIEKWRAIHRAAAELYKLAPWKYMEETDVFGVKTAASGKTYFISIMGSAGQVFAFSAYEGSRALESFWEMQCNEEVEPQSILVIPHMMLSFKNLKDIDKIQKEILKETDLFSTAHKKLPVLTQVIPGLVPALPRETYLDDMVEIIPQVVDVCSRASVNISLLLPEENDDETYLIREPGKEKGKTVWRDKYRKAVQEPATYISTIREEDIEPLRFLRRTQSVYQADYRIMPAPVREKGNPDYFPFTVLLTDKKSGIILGYKLVPPLPDYHSMVENMPLIIVELIKSLKVRPLRIEVRDLILFELLKPAMVRCEINIIRKPDLVSIDEAFEGLERSL
ncbi:MAG TPA: hypothetical protein DCY25_00180 [Bacteroidales bacterium]|nr:hypothetical protein [Bacteroidales bacterium]